MRRSPHIVSISDFDQRLEVLPRNVLLSNIIILEITYKNTSITLKVQIYI